MTQNIAHDDLKRHLKSLVSELVVPVIGPIWALAITAYGLALAFGPTTLDWGRTLWLVGGVVVMTRLLYFIGEFWLHKWPRFGLMLMETWVLAPTALAVLAAAATAKFSVALVAPEGATEEAKVMLSTMSTAVGAFLSAAFIARVSSVDGRSWLGRGIASSFERRFRSAKEEPRKERTFPVDVDNAGRWALGEDYGGVSGWGLQARWKRATELGRLIRASKPTKPPPRKIN